MTFCFCKYAENLQENNHAEVQFIELALRYGCSPVNLLHIFRTPFPKNTYGRQLLKFPLKGTASIKRNGIH